MKEGRVSATGPWWHVAAFEANYGAFDPTVNLAA